MTIIQLLLVVMFSTFRPSLSEKKSKLLLVQTFSRPGDLAPQFLYPMDPNSADDFPNGLGELTELGKNQQYNLGKYLRLLYKDSVTSDPKQVYVNSSSQDRCLNSAQSQLASFFAPDEKWMFTPDLHWQPIPVHYLPPEMDKYLNFLWHCPRAMEAEQYPEFKEYYQQHSNMVDQISNYSGSDISEPIHALYFAKLFETEKIHNLRFPEWADMYSEELKTMAEKVLAFWRSPLQIRLRVGSLLGLINENMEKKINGKTPNLKFILNFTHDSQLISVLTALSYNEKHQPPYCATLLIELHEMADSSKTVRVRYINSTYPFEDRNQPYVITINGCSEFCPVDYFMKSYQRLIPKNVDKECAVNSANSRRFLLLQLSSFLIAILNLLWKSLISSGM